MLTVTSIIYFDTYVLFASNISDNNIFSDMTDY